MADNISPDNARYLDEAVKQGYYSGQGEALDQAVELLRKRDRLRADVRAGIRQADNGEILPADEVFRRLEERAHKIEAAAKEQ